MFDIYQTHDVYEQHIADLKKHYGSSNRTTVRKPLKWIKQLLKRKDA